MEARLSYNVYMDEKIAATKFQELVQLERLRQNKKWSNQEKQHAVSPEKWVVILAEEFGEFAKEICEHDDEKAVKELVEVAAVCQRIFEVYLSDRVDVFDITTEMLHRAMNQKSVE